VSAKTPTLANYPQEMVRLACTKCERRGQYKRGRLIAEHGTDFKLPDLQHVLARCERRTNASRWRAALSMPIYFDRASIRLRQVSSQRNTALRLAGLAR
jgi:hypothetical protein